MKTETDLKNKCTPEFIKLMCELAEEFVCRFDVEFEDNIYYSHEDCEWVWIGKLDSVQFPLLIHRAVEGWNTNRNEKLTIEWNGIYTRTFTYLFIDYQPTNLTHAECAMLDCLIYIFEGDKK